MSNIFGTIKIKILCLILIIFSTSSCEKNLNLKTEILDEKTILYAILNSESPIEIIVDKSFSAIGKTIPDYKNFDPEVKVFENGILLPNMIRKDNVNFSIPNKIPLTNAEYIVSVSLNGNQTKSQKIIFPNAPQLVSISPLKQTSSPFKNSEAYFLEAKLKIKDMIDPYYTLSFEGIYNNEIINLNVFHPFKSNEIGDPCGQLVNYGTFWYSANCSTDSTLSMVLGFENRGYSNKLEKYVNVQKVKLKIGHVSESYKNMISDFVPEGLERVFGNVSNSFSNIENGLGVSGAINQISVVIPINQ